MRLNLCLYVSSNGILIYMYMFVQHVHCTRTVYVNILIHKVSNSRIAKYMYH